MQSGLPYKHYYYCKEVLLHNFNKKIYITSNLVGGGRNRPTDYQIYFVLWDKMITLSGYDNVLHQYRKLEHVCWVCSWHLWPCYALNLHTLTHWAEGAFGSVSQPDGDILCHSWCPWLPLLGNICSWRDEPIYRPSFAFYLVDFFWQKSRRFSFFVYQLFSIWWQR